MASGRILKALNLSIKAVSIHAENTILGKNELIELSLMFSYSITSAVHQLERKVDTYKAKVIVNYT